MLKLLSTRNHLKENQQHCFVFFLWPQFSCITVSVAWFCLSSLLFCEVLFKTAENNFQYFEILFRLIWKENRCFCKSAVVWHWVYLLYLKNTWIINLLLLIFIFFFAQRLKIFFCGNLSISRSFCKTRICFYGFVS